jgi:hypothetical protein
MPFDEATFWIGLTVAGTGLYFLIDGETKRRLLSLVLTAFGLLAVVYSVYVYYHPDRSIRPPVWVWLLVLTWLVIAADVYDRRVRRATPDLAGIGKRDDLRGPASTLSSGWESIVSVSPAMIRFLLKNVGLPRRLGHTTCFVTDPSGTTTLAIERPGPVQFDLGVYFSYPHDFGPNASLMTGSYHVRWETRMNVSDNPTTLYDGSVDVVITPPATQMQAP